jgi:hypothetical protein
MIARASRMDKRALQLAIERAWFGAGSASHIAQAFSTSAKQLHASDVQKIWADAKDRGDLPRVQRPNRGPKARRTA